MQCAGRNFERLDVVIHAPAFVFKDKFLYLLEFKKAAEQGFYYTKYFLLHFKKASDIVCIAYS